jgi:hypothetical protein
MLLALTVGLIAASAGPVSAGNLVERPFHASVEAEFEVVGVCPSGAPLSYISGSGTASHMGAITIEGQQCLGEPGEVTWTAANGDEITIQFITVLLAPPGPDGSAPFEMPASVVTGTGRFASAQFGDDQPLSGTVWLNPDGSGHLVGSTEGTIIYDASDSSNG